MIDHSSTIDYSRPDIALLLSHGYYPLDMHLHTTHSDGITRIEDLIRYASDRQIGVAITDHNEISGSLQALSIRSDVLIIPGIELETQEGPHLLFYFYTGGDMQDFYDEFSRRRTEKTPGLPKNLPVLDCLLLAESYDCLRIAAHPFGYYGINRGVLKCVEKQMLPGVLDHIDGIEVICGGMIESLNKKAIAYAEHHKIPYTGGSDAHILSDVGNVVTGVQADSVEDFLKGVLKRKNVVMGRPGGYIAKGATAGVIAWSFVPYSLSKLGAHYSVQKRRTSHLITSCQRKFTMYSNRKKGYDCSEERREKP
jgi:predicted metal-dependent phosphoesterase TrpH